MCVCDIIPSIRFKVNFKPGVPAMDNVILDLGKEKNLKTALVSVCIRLLSLYTENAFNILRNLASEKEASSSKDAVEDLL